MQGCVDIRCADDTVGFAPSLDNLHAICAHFPNGPRTTLWDSELKCGVMALGRHSDAVPLREQDERWQLGGGGDKCRLY